MQSGALESPVLVGEYSLTSDLPMSTNSRSTPDPSKYPNAGPNIAMENRIAESERGEKHQSEREITERAIVSL